MVMLDFIFMGSANLFETGRELKIQKWKCMFPAGFQTMLTMTFITRVSISMHSGCRKVKNVSVNDRSGRGGHLCWRNGKKKQNKKFICLQNVEYTCFTLKSLHLLQSRSQTCLEQPIRGNIVYLLIYRCTKIFRNTCWLEFQHQCISVSCWKCPSWSEFQYQFISVSCWQWPSWLAFQYQCISGFLLTMTFMTRVSTSMYLGSLSTMTFMTRVSISIYFSFLLTMTFMTRVSISVYFRFPVDSDLHDSSFHINVFQFPVDSDLHDSSFKFRVWLRITDEGSVPEMRPYC